MKLPSESRFRLCETSDGSWQFLRAGGYWVTYLGLDRIYGRFVTISFSSGLEHQATGVVQTASGSAERRIEGFLKIRHPSVARVFEKGICSSGNTYVIAEFVEGEPLLDYLRRNPKLPQEIVATLLFDLSDALTQIAEHPRILANTELNDFLVVLDRGIFPGLKLGRLGLDRDEAPVADYQLAEKWARTVAGLHGATALHAPDRFAELDRYHPAYRRYLGELAQRSGVEAISYLQRIRPAIQGAAGVDADGKSGESIRRVKLKELRQASHGPLQNLMFRSHELRERLGRQFRLRPDEIRFGVSPFVFPAEKVDTDQENAEAEKVELYFLPPERLFEESRIDPLNQKMFDDFLKIHPNGIRTRSLICEEDYTMVVADRFEGLPLPILQARRKRFSPIDVLKITRQLSRVLSHFEGAGFLFRKIHPWQIEICFDHTEPKEIPKLLEKTPIANWPTWDLKLRVETPTEVFLEPYMSSWSHLLRRFEGKTFPTLLVWLLSGDRFDWALRNSTAGDEPLSWNPDLNSCFEAVAHYFSEESPEDRKKLIDYVASAFDRRVDLKTQHHGFGEPLPTTASQVSPVSQAPLSSEPVFLGPMEESTEGESVIL